MQVYIGFSGTVCEHWAASHFMSNCPKGACRWCKTWPEFSERCPDTSRVPRLQGPYEMDKKLNQKTKSNGDRIIRWQLVKTKRNIMQSGQDIHS